MKKVPLWRCRRCARFRKGYCPLQDLEPCSFVQDPHKEAPADMVLCAVALVVLLISLIIVYL